MRLNLSSTRTARFCISETNEIILHGIARPGLLAPCMCITRPNSLDGQSLFLINLHLVKHTTYLVDSPKYFLSILAFASPVLCLVVSSSGSTSASYFSLSILQQRAASVLKSACVYRPSLTFLLSSILSFLLKSRRVLNLCSDRRIFWSRFSRKHHTHFGRIRRIWSLDFGDFINPASAFVHSLSGPPPQTHEYC